MLLFLLPNQSRACVSRTALGSCLSLSTRSPFSVPAQAECEELLLAASQSVSPSVVGQWLVGRSVSRSLSAFWPWTRRRGHTHTHMQQTHNRLTHARQNGWQQTHTGRGVKNPNVVCFFFSIFPPFTSLLSKAALSVRLISNMLGLRCLASALFVLSFFRCHRLLTSSSSPLSSSAAAPSTSVSLSLFVSFFFKVRLQSAGRARGRQSQGWKVGKSRK